MDENMAGIIEQQSQLAALATPQDQRNENEFSLARPVVRHVQALEHLIDDIFIYLYNKTCSELKD